MGDLSLIIIITRMKVLLLLSFVAFTSIHLVQGGCKAKVSNAVINRKLKPFTVVDKKGKPVATAPCWWDLTRENCGKCKKGGRQCGFPMHKWCQSPRVKTGCPGIPGNKYTLSTEGAPCYWDPTNLKCAICTKKTMKQCINTLPAQLNIDCLSTCGTPKNKKCDGNLASCVTIPYCGAGASCNKKSGRCKCAAGMLGNGQQCFEGDCPGANCTLVANAGQCGDQHRHSERILRLHSEIRAVTRHCVTCAHINCS